MKRIITSLIILLCQYISFGQSQPPTQVWLGPLYRFNNGLKIDSALFIPRKDTATTNVNLVGRGMLTYRPSDQKLWLRNDTGWVEIGKDPDLSAYVKRDSLGFVNVQWYGAVGDSSTDNTAAIQAAVNAAAGGVVYFPPGKYLTTGGIQVNYPTTIIGAGGWKEYDYAAPDLTGGQTRIICTSATNDLFLVNSDNVSFEKVALESRISTPAGDGIVFNRGNLMRLQNMSVKGFDINVNIVNGLDWMINGVFFIAPQTYNLKIAHHLLPDGGDQSITSSWFYSGAALNTTHIRYESGGGLKIVNTKFNESFVSSNFPLHCIDVAMTHNTVIMLISNCSFENFTGSAVKLRPAGFFANVKIEGSEIVAQATMSSPLIDLGGGGGVLNSVVISDNIFALPADLTQYAVQLTDVNHVNIGHNDWGTWTRRVNLVNCGNVDVMRSQIPQLLADGATITYNLDLGNNAEVTLGGNRTIALTNKIIGDRFVLKVVQDATGGRTLTWPGGTQLLGSELNTAPNSVTIFHGYIDAFGNAIVQAGSSKQFGEFRTGTTYAEEPTRLYQPNGAGTLEFSAHINVTDKAGVKIGVADNTGDFIISTAPTVSGASSLTYTERFRISNNGDITANGIKIISGSGTPEGSVSAPVGSWYSDVSGGVPYFKASGAGNTGWKAITLAP